LTDLAEKYGPWAVVTGASSGLGSHFARQLAAMGFNLVLSARRRERLEQLAANLQADHQVQCRVIALDLSLEGAAPELASQTGKLDVGLLVNNAGLGYYGRFLDQDPTRHEKMIRLNCIAPAFLAHHFLNRFRERECGAMVLVASTAAYQPTPYMGLYGATKGFDLLLGESLSQEMQGSGVDIQVLSPGATLTEFQESAGGAPHGGADPASVVRSSLSSLGRKRAVVPGLGNKCQVWANRLFPRRFVTAMAARVLSRFAFKPDS
jgi:uncharacterized protein